MRYMDLTRFVFIIVVKPFLLTPLAWGLGAFSIYKILYKWKQYSHLKLYPFDSIFSGKTSKIFLSIKDIEKSGKH